jgi:hypothetical protein
MLSRLAAPFVLLAALASTGAANASGAAIPTLDPTALPALPAQGLVVQRAGDVLLETTGGASIGRLAGFSVDPPSKLTDARFAKSVGIQALASADPALTVLFDRSGGGWTLDVAGRRLRPIGAIETPLANGAVLRVIVDRQGEGVSTRTVVERGGKPLLAGTTVATVGGRYAASNDAFDSKPNTLIDLATGRRTKLGPRCVLAGVHAGGAIAACTSSDGTKPTGVYRFAADGARRLLTPIGPGAYPTTASLSPDGRWVLLYLQPNCGPGWAAVAPSSGGPARFVAGGGRVPATTAPGGASPPFSWALGWTAQSRIVATITGKGSCEGHVTTGTYTIEPATLAATLATPARAVRLWGAA